MRWFRAAVITVVVLAAVCAALCAEPVASRTPDQMTEQFFALLKDNKPVEAVNSVWSSNSWMERKQDAADKLRSGLTNAISLIGQYHGFELLSRRQMGNRLVYMSFVAYYDRQPMRFEFEFYRADQTWALYTLSYDDNLDEELKNAGRADSTSK